MLLLHSLAPQLSYWLGWSFWEFGASRKACAALYLSSDCNIGIACKIGPNEDKKLLYVLFIHS